MENPTLPHLKYDPWANFNIIGEFIDLIPYKIELFEITVIILLLVIIWLLWKRKKD